MIPLSDRIDALARRAADLEERLQKAMRSRGIDGDGDGIYNEGAAPAASKPKRPLKRPQKPQQAASDQPASKPAPAGRRARSAQQKPSAKPAPDQAEGERAEA